MRRLPGLDLLRAIAVVWVMLFHSFIVGGLGPHFTLLQKYGWMGVDLFFVLSGYLIGSQLLLPLSRGEPQRFTDFYLRRALRILPAYWVVLTLYFSWPLFREENGIQPLWQFLTFTVNLLIDYRHNKAFAPAWSLCVEEHFYLVIPWLAWWLVRSPSAKRFIGICLSVAIAGMIIRGYVWLHDMAPLIGRNDDSFDMRFAEGIYYPTWTRLDDLLAGVILATVRAYRPALWSQWQERANVLLLVGLIIIAEALWLFKNPTELAPSVIGYPLLAFGFACLVASGTGSQGWLGKVRIPGIGWLALISYSLYLTHRAVFHLVQTAWPQLHGPGAFVVYAPATLTAGALLHYTVEWPFLRWRNRLLSISSVTR